MWGGQRWEDGYFVRSVGDAVTAELIRRYIRYQKSPQNVQLRLFGDLYFGLGFYLPIRAIM